MTRFVWAGVLALALRLLHSVPVRAHATDALPPAAEWKQQLERDILAVLGNAGGAGRSGGKAFPTFRCNDGTVTNPRAPCAEDF